MSTDFILIIEVIKQSIKIKLNYFPLCDLILLRSSTPAQLQANSHVAKTKSTSKQ